MKEKKANSQKANSQKISPQKANSQKANSQKAHRARADGLKVVGASAGTGKTYRLTAEVEEAVAGEGAAGIRADGLVAVTYTRRAQVELESRIRRKLLASKNPDRAARLSLAYLGTVHAVCLRWVRELALDAGVSPHLEVLAEDGLALASVLEETVPAQMREELDELAERLQIHFNAIEGQVYWDQPVEDIISLARSGRIAPDKLAEMAELSWQGYAELFSEPASDGPTLDRALETAVERALAAIDTRSDTSGVTRKAVDALEDYRRAVQRGRATWTQWVILSQRNAGKDSNAALADVHSAAKAWARHPQLREDLRRFIELVYRAAALTLERYASWKKQRGLVDYVDMIEGALALLEDEEVANDLAEKLQLVVVDELQDSSPIQLALFLRLHAIAKRSTWVGDPKQCIFEYAGADPALMDSVLKWASGSGGQSERQKTNYRSRPALVDLCNAVFTAAFEGHEVHPDDITVQANRAAADEPALDALPAVGLFYFEGKVAQQAASIAAGVARLLASPEETPVRDRVTGQTRPVEPGDIAILVATNNEGKRIAEALASLGLRATFARAGLLGTPEGVATAAGLRFLLDSRDSLAIAELEALHGFHDQGPDAWLSGRLAAATDEAHVLHALPKAPWRDKLDALRSSVVLLSPQELVCAVIVALDLPTLAARWPDPAQRLGNLDALRKFARVYEQRCVDNGEGCSLSGLVRFLDDLTRTTFRRGEERRADEQHSSGDASAVTVMTYHRSKGLEWNVVVLSSLDHGARPGIFDVAPESTALELNPDDPLAGRWIRYWPWPFGNPKTKADLRKLAEGSPVGDAEIERERRERARLLYVGFTRARDHLIFAAAVTKGVPNCQWLSELAAHRTGDSSEGSEGPVVTLPSADAQTPVIEIAGPMKRTVPARLFRLEPSTATERPEPERRWFRRTPHIDRSPYRIQPSRATAADLQGPSPTLCAVHILHEPLARVTRGPELGEVHWSRVGDAVHAFLAADVEGLPTRARAQIAARLIDAYSVQDAYSVDSFLAASDAFTAFAHAQVPNAKWTREVPIQARIPTEEGERAIDGRIDLLLETDEEIIIVDHKTFPGVGERAWRAKAELLCPQLAGYARAVAMARPDKRIVGWIHFATGGAIIGYQLSAMSFSAEHPIADT